MMFYEKSVHEVTTRCVTAARIAARKCPTAMNRKGGILRFDFCPESGDDGWQFRKWLGIPECATECDSAQLVYRIFPDWDFRIRESGIVDCAAYAEMMIASAAIRAAKGSGAVSGECANIANIPREDCIETYGYAERDGAAKLLVEVDGVVTGDVFVAVFGGTSREDREILGAATRALMDFFFEDERVKLVF